MLNKILCLTTLSAFVLCGAYAEDQITSEDAQLADGYKNRSEELFGRCPCRDKKDNPPADDTTLACGCDEEEGDDIVNASSNLAHHGEESDHEPAVIG